MPSVAYLLQNKWGIQWGNVDCNWTFLRMGAKTPAQTRLNFDWKPKSSGVKIAQWAMQCKVMPGLGHGTELEKCKWKYVFHKRGKRAENKRQTDGTLSRLHVFSHKNDCVRHAFIYELVKILHKSENRLFHFGPFNGRILRPFFWAGRWAYGIFNELTIAVSKPIWRSFRYTCRRVV